MAHVLPLPLLVALLLGAPLLGACAHGGERLDRVAITEVAKRDPWERTNRQIFHVSTQIDRYALSPVTNVYRTVLPAEPRRAIANGYNLLQEPTNLGNALAQGKIKSAFRAVDRILINGTLGLVVADHASAIGLVEQEHDFGQTMAVWGVPSGPFLMLPFLGPSTVRDGAGFFTDFLLDPVDLLQNRLLSFEERMIWLGVRVLDIRSGLRDKGEQLLQGAADPYATTRAAWLQLRRYQIFDGNLPDADEDRDIPPPPGGPLEEPTPAPLETPAQTSAEAPVETGPSGAVPLPSPPPAADAATAPSTPAGPDRDPALQPG
jgi:phospholipid-binding lipoprotein MlaA